MYPLRLRLALLSVVTIAGCGTEDEAAGAPVVDAGLADASAVPSPWPPGCEIPAEDYLPRTLECTGLYSGDLVTKTLAGDVREFAPAVSLWSDAADKRRWIKLPPGTTIDTSDPSEWAFPVGTKTWKEFRKNGKRVETRLFFKESADNWKRATYVWRDGETSATLWEDQTGVSNVLKLSDGSDYQLPTRIECNECHKGRKDKVLGFEQLLLGLPGASGMTLEQLIREKRLSQPPDRSAYRITDDGTGASAAALAYMHVNCGISCHNESSVSLGYPTGMFLRLDPTRLDGPQPEWNPMKTTLNVPAHVVNFAGAVRIVPGSPRGSLIVDVASTRGSNRQMPPIGSRVVDGRGVALISDWITKLGKLDAGSPTPDAGVPATPDSATPGPVI